MKEILTFLGMLGPGIITGSVDNDAGGITTYSVAGATYGYPILWTLLPSFIVLLVVQEMNMRICFALFDHVDKFGTRHAGHIAVGMA